MLKTGAGLTTGSAGFGCGAALSRTIGWTCGTGAAGSGCGAAAFCAALGTGGTPLETGVDEAVAGEPGLLFLKYSTHAGSTEEGSCR